MNRRGLLKLFGIAPTVAFAPSEAQTPVEVVAVETAAAQSVIGSSEYFLCCSTATTTPQQYFAHTMKARDKEFKANGA